MLPHILRDFLRTLFLAIAAVAVFAAGLWMWGMWHDEWSGLNASMWVSDGYCSIAVIPITGEIVSYDYYGTQGEEGQATSYTIADRVIENIYRAQFDPAIRGILLRIDSPGGWPVASTMIADAIKESPLPVAALIRDSGTSGGYLVASAADTVIAHEMSDVGSIGITMSYISNALKNEKEGLEFVALSSGPFKDAGYPDKVLTEEERALFERDLKISHDAFVRMVAENRGLTIEEVAKLADGSSLPGTLALEAKLVDAVGNESTAIQWFATLFGVPKEEVRTCWPLM